MHVRAQTDRRAHTNTHSCLHCLFHCGHGCVTSGLTYFDLSSFCMVLKTLKTLLAWVVSVWSNTETMDKHWSVLLRKPFILSGKICCLGLFVFELVTCVQLGDNGVLKDLWNNLQFLVVYEVSFPFEFFQDTTFKMVCNFTVGCDRHNFMMLM